MNSLVLLYEFVIYWSHLYILKTSQKYVVRLYFMYGWDGCMDLFILPCYSSQVHCSIACQSPFSNTGVALVLIHLKKCMVMIFDSVYFTNYKCHMHLHKFFLYINILRRDGDHLVQYLLAIRGLCDMLYQGNGSILTSEPI